MGAYLKQNKILEFVLVMGIAIVFLAVLMVLLGSNAQADVIVDQSGGGNYLTIQEGIDNAIPGENVFVWDGSYNENITINKSLQLIGNGSATTIIDGFGTMNNIINITAEGVEITGFNFSESGLWYGIWANVGGFYIHDNVFDTQNWAIYMDINRLNSGSTTVGDIIVDNNEVIGTHGFYFNIWLDEPLTGSNFIFGKTVITNNTLHNTTTGIEIDRYTVFNMNQGSITWGDILVKDNFINTSVSYGIHFWGIFWNITDVNIDLGKIDVSDNNLTAQTYGIYIDWWNFCDGVYGNTIATTQDTYIYGNNIVSQSESGGGIILQPGIIGDIIYDSASVTTGDFFIYSNNITTAGIFSEGISVYISETGRDMYNDSSVNFGNIYVDSNIVDSNNNGIYFNYRNCFGTDAYDNAIVTMGDVQVTNNEILSVDHGIYLSLESLGNSMHDQASATLGGFFVNNNNITSVNLGINIQGKNIARNMHNDSTFAMGDFTVNYNTINSTTNMGIDFDMQNSAYNMTGNATVTFGNFLFTNNNITALNSHGLWFAWYNIGFDMHNGAVVTAKDFHLDDNTIECGPNGWGIYSDFIDIGNNMHGDSLFSLGDWNAEGNIILSGYLGIYAGPQFWGNDMYDNSIFIYGDFFIRNNEINVTGGGGIMIDYIDTGENMAGTSSVTGGNMSITNNIVLSRDNYGFYIYYDFIGYNITDFSYVSTGWIDISYNNFSSVNNHGAYIWIYYLGAYMYGNSQVYISDFMFTHNNVWSDTMDALHFYQFYQNAYQMHNDSYVQIGNILVNDNYLNASGAGNGIELFQWQQNAYEMSHNASADFGNFEFLHNNITSYDEGINLWFPHYFAAYMYNNTSAFFGDFLINNNIINTTSSGGDGIYIEQFRYLGYQMNDQSYAEFGNFECSGNEILVASLANGIYIRPGSWAYNMYDNATFIMGDWLINNNTVFSSEYEGIYFYSTGFGNIMYGNSSAHIGKNEIMYNTVNSTGGDGIESTWWFDFGGNMFDYSYFEVGSCYIMFNNITSTSTSPWHYGLETGPQRTGWYVYDEAEAYFGDYIISNNIIYSNGTEGIDLWYDTIGYWLDNSNLPESRAVVEIGRVMVTDNVITVPNGKGIYVWGRDVALSVNDYCLVTTGGIHFSRNTINSFGHGIDIYMYQLGENNGNNAQVWLGSFVIDDNIITATNGNGIYIYSEFFAYSTYDNAFVSMDDIFITNNDIVAGITGIELTCYAWIELYSNSEARAPGLWITGNNVSAPVSAFNYTTISTPARIDPGNTFSTGNVRIEDNIFNGGMFGVMIDWQDMLPSGEGQPDFYFENNSIENGSANSIGLFMNNIQNATIESLNVDSYDQGIYVRNSNIWYMFNSTISNIPSYDLNLTSNSFIGAVNTTFDNASVYFEDNNCLLNVGWFMNVYVQSQVFLPVPDANLTVKDVDGTDIFNGTTNLNGRAFYIICWEYQENKTGIIKNFNDYTADANKAGSFGSAVPNPTMNQTRLVVIILTDLIPPTIFSDNSDTAGTTGDPFYFEINATDNMGIVSVHVNYRFDGVGPYTNLTMSGTGPYWLNEILPSDYVGFIEYYFTAVDSGGFWVNTTPTTTPITDNDPPTIISDNSDTLATTGEIFNFNVDATDNINMSEVHVVWWFGAGAPTNDTMTGTGPYTFSIPVPPDSLDQLHYYFTMNDTEGNWLVGPLVDINVTDNDAPPYTWVSQPSAGTTGESVLVSLLATDNIDITYYKIDIDGTLYDLIKDGNYYNFTINIPTDNLAGITYSIIFNDSANNPNSTAPTVITVSDNDQPTFSWVSQLTLGTTGESVLVSILATDNIGITYYKIDIDGTLYNLIKDGNYYNYTINIPLDSATTITYSIILNDSANNPNIITPTMITVTDNDQPTYSWVLQPISGTTGESVPVSILATDNIGITYYKIEIDGMLYDLIKDGDYYNYTINIPPDSIANFTYRLIINDSANNPNIIPDTVIVVTDNDAPTYNWVSKPSAGVVGSSVLVSLTAYDNIGITNYTIYIDGVPFDMVKDGDYYNYTIDIPSGIPVDIIYNVTLRDTAGNLVATGDTIIGVISVDDEVPEYNWILHPATGTTGESVLVSLLATDNIGITYYKIEIDGVLYDLLKEGDYYNYSINIPSDSVTGVTYRVIFNDTTDNPVTTGDTTITVTDNDNPTYSWVLQPSTGSAGGSVLVSLLASDNIGVTYYKIDVDGISYDLIKDGDYYNYTINIPNDSLTGITYKVIFKDTADNSNTTVDATVTITDNDVPTDLVDASDTTATTGDMFTFEFDASDNIGLSKVEIFYWFGAGSETSQVVTGSGPFTYTITIPSDSLDDLHYYVKIEDTAGNSMTGSTIDITVTDNDTPYDIIDNSDTTATTGDDFTFNVNASDNIEIGGVEIYYWFGDGDETLLGSIGTGPFETTISLPLDSTEILHYYFVLIDAADNELLGPQVDVTITDNDPGTISNDQTDTTAEEGEDFTFQIDASDNIGVSQVRVAYWFGDDETQKQFITLTVENGTYSGSFTPDESGTLNYYFEVTDSAGNIHEGSQQSVQIASEPKEEEEEPTLLPWILVIIIILVVLIFFFLIMKKGKDGEEISEVEEGLGAEVELEGEVLEEPEDIEVDSEEEPEVEGEIEEVKEPEVESEEPTVEEAGPEETSTDEEPMDEIDRIIEGEIEKGEE